MVRHVSPIVARLSQQRDCPRVTNCFTLLLLFQDTSEDKVRETGIKVCFIIQRDPGFRLGYARRVLKQLLARLRVPKRSLTLS